MLMTMMMMTMMMMLTKGLSYFHSYSNL